MTTNPLPFPKNSLFFKLCLYPARARPPWTPASCFAANILPLLYASCIHLYPLTFSPSPFDFSSLFPTSTLPPPPFAVTRRSTSQSPTCQLSYRDVWIYNCVCTCSCVAQSPLFNPLLSQTRLRLDQQPLVPQSHFFLEIVITFSFSFFHFFLIFFFLLFLVSCCV